MNVETIDQYLARGGKITVCPAAGSGEVSWAGHIERVGPTVRGAGWYAIVRMQDDDRRYRLPASEWRGKERPIKGQAVTFMPATASGKALARLARPAT